MDSIGTLLYALGRRCLRKGEYDDDEQAPLGSTVFGRHATEGDDFRRMFPGEAEDWVATLTPRAGPCKEVAADEDSEADEAPAITPLFEAGTFVEYFCSEAGWVSGRLEVLASGKHEDVRVVYNVHVTSVEAAVCEDVCLHEIRLPLEVEERVEVHQAHDEWLPAVVLDRRAGGYLVKVEGQAPRTLELPGASLRRRFLPGSRVRRYKGPRDGWAEAEVARLAEAAPGEPGVAAEGHTAEAALRDVVPVVDTNSELVRLVPSYLVYALPSNESVASRPVAVLPVFRIAL